MSTHVQEYRSAGVHKYRSTGAESAHRAGGRLGVSVCGYDDILVSTSLVCLAASRRALLWALRAALLVPFTYDRPRRFAYK